MKTIKYQYNSIDNGLQIVHASMVPAHIKEQAHQLVDTHKDASKIMIGSWIVTVKEA